MGKMNQSAKMGTPKKGSIGALVVGKYLSDFLVYGSTIFWIFFLVPGFFLLSLVFLFFTGESNAKCSDFPIFLFYILIILFFALILGLLWLGFKYLKGFYSYLRSILIKDVSDQELLAKLEIADEGERLRALTQCLIHESYQAQVRVEIVDVREEKNWVVKKQYRMTVVTDWGPLKNIPLQVVEVEKVEKSIHQDDAFAEIRQPKWED
jgi:hypothetical protein